jgi:ubiquinone/menaquinone biosynthesis C-methylase UbiE
MSIAGYPELRRLATVRAEGPVDKDVARFDRWARSYDRSFLQRRVFEPVHADIRSALEPLEGARVLDVGAGTGTLALVLSEKAALVVGVDAAPRMTRAGGRLVIADIDVPGPLRAILRAMHNSHAGWSRRELADLLYEGGFHRVRARRSPLGPRLPIVLAER